MSHAEWCDEVDEELGKAGVAESASAWLYREAYYDGFSPEEAVKIALSPRYTFRGACVVPYLGNSVVKPSMP